MLAPGRAVLLALLIAAATGQSGPVSGQVRNFTHYTAFEGLPQAQVLGMAQDPRGYIWIASYAGLSRFNGAEFLTLTTADGLASNSVLDVAVDERGRLVAGTSRGVCVLEGEQFRCWTGSDGLANDYIRSVAPDGADGIWVSTSVGVSHVSADGVRNWGHRQGLPSDRVSRVEVDSAGRVWAATAEGLARLEGDRFESAFAELLGGREVNFVRTVRGGVLVGSAGRLFVLRDGVANPVSVVIPDGMQLTDGAIDPDGTIWVSALGGALRIADGRVQVLTEQNGLLSDLVNNVVVDREGGVWFGTESGASKHVPGPFTTYTEHEGVPNPFVRAVELDETGAVWVGTRNGVAVFRDGSFEEIPLVGVADARVYGISRTPDGGMLVGTRRSLVYLKDGRVGDVLDADDGLPGDYVYGVLLDGDGVWVATDRGLVRWVDGALERIDQPDIEALSIMSMGLDGTGRLWLGLRSGGVAIWDGETLETIGPEQGMSAETVWAISLDAQNRVWVGTNGDGAYRFGPSGFDRLTVEDGLASNFVWQVLPDSRGDIWLFGNVGLDRLIGDRIVHYGTGSGLIELEGSVSAAREDRDGNLWFGTGKGVVRYVAGLDQPAVMPPPVYVEDVTHEGEPVQGFSALATTRTDDRVRLHAGAIRLEFGSPSYRDESVIRYRYRLRGAGDAWSASTAERSITYAGLEPGHYTFEVLADNRGVVSETPATYAFTIVPAFWQTWWFRGFAILLLAAFTGAMPAWRASRLEKERRRLEALVAQHTRELAEKNERLEHSNRDLEHFAYVASHDLQEPLRKIRAFSDRVSRRYAAVLDDQGRDYLARTENAASRMQRLIDDLLSLSRVTTRKQPMQVFALGQLVREVVADLEIRLQSTGGRVDIGELPEIEADPAQIRQLMQNLIGNALKFHRPDEPPVVRVSATAAGPGRVEIRVEDNGIGFDTRDAEKLFLPFQRLHSRMQYEGTGIGLSICQKIVERHGGTIRAESEPGVGSKFIAVIPIRQPQVEAHAA